MSARHETPAFRTAELAAILARHYPDAAPHNIAELIADMQRATRAAKRFAEDQCNFDLGDPDAAHSDYARRSKRQNIAESRINAVLMRAKLYNLRYTGEAAPHAAPAKVDLGGDPRGPCGRLHVPGQRGDGWGDGFAIY